MQILPIGTTVRNTCITGDLHIAEDLLTQDINADGNNHGSYAIRSVVRARNSEWNKALQDSVTSIATQPSLFGYISKGIALCGNDNLLDAMEAFDLACVFSDRHPITADLLLLIKAVALFNANHHDEARRRVQGLAAAYQCSDTLLCRVVNLAILDFVDGRYSEAADRLNDSIPCVTDLFPRRALFEPRLKIFTVLFGWDLDSKDAVESHQCMMRMIDEHAKDSDLEWSTAFKQDCAARYAAKGDKANGDSDFEGAIELYSVAIGLDSSCYSLFVHRGKVKLRRDLYAEALHDAEKAIELNPSSYFGYELKRVALLGAHRYNEAIEAFKTMHSKLDDASDAQIQKLHEQYVQYKELLYSSMTHAPLQTKPIQEVVTRYFSWVMLSHRWETKEPLLHDIQDKVVFDLDPVGTVNNNVELQRSVNSMFVWYRESALTIVYLSDVPPSSTFGALANSAWNTRGWTVQEFLAPNALVAFRPGMTGAREKLQWASTRATTLPEDIAYSLFGIFGVHLPVIYGETKQNALGRLLQEIVAQPGDITALDWVGKSSQFNSCLPAEIASYKPPSCMPPSPSEDQIQMLQLPCIAFTVTALIQRRGQDQGTFFTYDVKADGLRDLLITTEDKLRPASRTFLLIRPWNRHDLGLPDDADETQSVDEPESVLDDTLGSSPRDDEPANSTSYSRASWLIGRLGQPFAALLPAHQYKHSESHSRASRLMVRLGQPFGALLLAQQRGGEYKRIASDNNIIARVRDVVAVRDMMDVRTLEIV
ncbi:hypothetical protein DFH29DRAFT_876116 [Suillus ampliporus]|nr:hypothetical protein DFH29DRAFT_876116 [Suillus ampliporus]